MIGDAKQVCITRWSACDESVPERNPIHAIFVLVN